ncbi:bifunctional 4-hydroxy-2-oxoglutarate aldolase/2-dehydro-3-deoxy-phosphogluconate aldolase [Nocardia sp. alder85J]|uniref:bifunctional 4-hydroxy-2-oxoglutarate aldolase/2-dehydro-3-deoxy-phosphogluconate aldolase n=1 Tax=Nocardia sp. alder85J TaxID=2862949 RepID=UPI001CD4810D|nr:bifunctional 4-hydroxy-2-oxoglutarate aldolase/2-dehydro-3-deoxy-phosphogluconate aldolase [Nocardia sp. alder85J]MCX4094847.1 bifunctional 4-hydroxy-2-oxoglutarate aldolase/2-dehydro-3-deoxy-phosphogluconate aldolase [Nocardia sp. alder85J]
MKPLSQVLAEHRLLVILRAAEPVPLVDVSLALIDAGVRCLEITVSTPGALAAVRAVVDQVGDVAYIGTGTVMSVDDVRRSADARARFVVSPTFDPDVVAAANSAGLGSLPGVFTPTEIVTAWRSRPTALKVFPAFALGPEYIAAVRDPLPHIPLVAVGGVTLDNIGDYFSAGATAVAVGRPVLGDALRLDHSPTALRNLRTRTAQFVAAAKDERQPPAAE